MIVIRHLFLWSILTLVGCAVTAGDKGTDAQVASSNAKKLVIAHRGASGYLPEHTLAAKAMAYAQGADYIEQDLVMTKDDELVVLHDRYLDTVTDVRSIFPDRSREDGRFYVVDFTLQEIRRLSVLGRFELKDGIAVPVFEGRFPLGKSSFRVHTFAEEIELIQGLNVSTGKSIGIYPEIKSPAFHREEGKDISAAVLDALKEHGYDENTDKIFLQCFNPYELQRIHNELMPDRNMTVPLIQLIDTKKEFRSLLTAEGMQQLATFVDGIGPSVFLLAQKESVESDIRITRLVEFAHAVGLKVHPFISRREASQMPPLAKNYEDFLGIFFDDVGVDGIFTDFPDVAVNYLESRQ